MRWADLDLLGHVNNAVYVDYLQEARVDMLRVHARDRRADDLAEGVVVVRHEVQYVAPLTFRFEPVRIETWVTEIRAASFTLAYEVFDETAEGRRVYLRATTVLTPYVFATERPRRLTPEERAALERYRDEPPAGAARRRPVRRRRPGGGEQVHYDVHVRFSDVDVYGHVNNVIYFEYFQEARIPLLAGLGRELPVAGADGAGRRGADRRRLPAADPVPRRSRTTAGRASARRHHLADPRARRSATATRCSPGRG